MKVYMYHRVYSLCIDIGLLFDIVEEFLRDVIYNNSKVVATVVNRPSNFSVPHVLFDLTFDFLLESPPPPFSGVGE